jgi:hypothetical protein
VTETASEISVVVVIYLRNGAFTHKGSKPEAADVVAAFVPTRPKISESYMDLIIQLIGSHPSGSPEID